MVEALRLALVNFSPVQVKEPVSQADTLRAFCWGIVKSHCVRHGITDDQEVAAVYSKLRSAVDKYSVSPTYISQRQGVVSISPGEVYPEAIQENGERLIVESTDMLFRDLREKDISPDGLAINARMKLFDQFVSHAVEEMYATDAGIPDDMVHVTCSGYVSPNPLERLVSQNSWNTTVSNCYHKGCYAFFPGLRIAAGTFASAAQGWTTSKNRVDVVHTEVLSLHLKLSSCLPEDLVTQTLFSDGFIKYSLIPEHLATPGTGKGFRLLTYKESVLPGSLDAMTWCVGDFHFDMTLTIQVPIRVEQDVAVFVDELFRQAGLDFQKEKSDLYFAIHPGGPKILDFVRNRLELAPEQVEHSYQVLAENGNMSSATVPFLLHRILHDDQIPAGTLVPALGFGPGLTMSGAILQKIDLP